jgi:Secretion system C-terminal sorting domain
MKKTLQLFAILFAFGQITFAQTSTQLLNVAKTFPAMPRETGDLLSFYNASHVLTFGSGTPCNDVEWTLFDTDYMDGENAAFDVFQPADPGDTYPGSNTVKLIRCTISINNNDSFGAQKGDRIILGTAQNTNPFFLKGTDGIDNDYVVIQNFDYNNGYIQLKGASADYKLYYGTKANGCATTGWYLFYTKNFSTTNVIDLIAFIQPCDDVETDEPNPNTQLLCNADKSLSLTNTNQFKYAAAITTTVQIPSGITQFGSAGRENNAGITVDKNGNIYLFGSGDGNLDGGTGNPDNEMYIAKFNPNGTKVWVREIGEYNGALLFDAVTDDYYLYAAGRTFGAIPGFTNSGKWDGIILKLNLSDGVIVDSDQWGNAGNDGYGNITLDDNGGLYVSGAGGPAGTSQKDSLFLIAKHNTSNLNNVWRVLAPATSTSTDVVEGWGGITYIPTTTPGAGKLVVGGWFISPGKASDGFLAMYNNLNTSSPTRTATQVISSPGAKPDWVLDNIADSNGNIYAVGFTTGDLSGTHKGNGDMFVVKYNSNLASPVYAQWGTNRADQFRKIGIDASNNLYALGYTYGDYTSGSYTGTNLDASRLTGDIVIQKFNSSLTRSSTLQFGSKNEDRGSIFVKGNTVYVGGMTEGSLVKANIGSFDAFAVAFNTNLVVTTPSTARIETSEIEPNADNDAFADVTIFPNPSQDEITISKQDENPINFSITDVTGKEMQSGILQEKVNKIDLKNINTGLYFIKLSEEEKSKVFKLMKR